MVCLKAKLSVDIHARAVIQLAANLVSEKVVIDVKTSITFRDLIADRTIDVVRKLKIVANLSPSKTVASRHADPTLQARTSGPAVPP